MNTVDLTVSFLRHHDSTLVRWESPVIGVRQSHFAAPYDTATLPLVMRALDQSQTKLDPLGLFETAEQQELARYGLWHPDGWLPSDLAVLVGQSLYRALTADPAAAAALASVRDHARRANLPLALHLRFPPTDIALAALPWETLSDSDGIALLIGATRTATCTRYLDLAQALPPPRTTHLPLRMLVLAPHTGIPADVRAAEQQARWQAWEPLLQSGRMVVQEISPVTREQLIHTLQTMPTPDVVHFYGHGRYTDEGAALLLDDPQGGEDWLAARAAAALLGQVRLLALFACQGAMLDPAHGLLSGLAPLLSAAGVPTVLAMQLSVRVEAATRASSVMYRALAAGWSIQQAVALARQTLYILEPDMASWYVPVLYVRAATPEPVYLLPPTPAARPARQIVRRGPRQQLIARQHSQISGVQMGATGTARQQIHASGQSQIARVQVRGTDQSDQAVLASDASQISDAQIEAG